MYYDGILLILLQQADQQQHAVSVIYTASRESCSSTNLQQLVFIGGS